MAECSSGGSVLKPNRRPLKFEDMSPDEMERRVDCYFHHIKKKNEAPSVTELCLHLGFSSRKQLIEYKENEKLTVEFRNIIKKAVSKIEAIVEKMCIKEGKSGQIFWLKNHGWADTVEHELGPRTFEHFSKEKAMFGAK